MDMATIADNTAQPTQSVTPDAPAGKPSGDDAILEKLGAVLDPTEAVEAPKPEDEKEAVKYELKWGEDETYVPDEETVKFVNEIGGKYKMANEDAQLLVGKATEYARGEVTKAQESFQNTIIDMAGKMADEGLAACKSKWGKDYDKVESEVAQGYQMLVASGRIPRGFSARPELRIALNQPEIRELFMDYYRHNAEPSTVNGGQRAVKNDGIFKNMIY